MPEEGQPRQVAVGVEAPDSSPTVTTVDVQPITIAFYTCGDGGCAGRLFNRLDPTDAYRQLAHCLSSPDSRSSGGKHAYPQIELPAAIQNHTFGVQDATTVLDALPTNTRVEKIYFVGHGTGIPAGYFFSGTNRDRDTNVCLGREAFEINVMASLFHLSIDEVVNTMPWEQALVDALNNAQDSEDNLQRFRDNYGRTFAEAIGINGEQLEVQREYTDRQWILREGEWIYPIRRRRSGATDDAGAPIGGWELCILGRYTPHLRDCHRLVDAMKRRLITGGHVGFLSCFSGGGNLVEDLHRLITEESSPVPAVADVTIGAYEDYFETGYTRLRQESNDESSDAILLVEEWHNRIIEYHTDDVISEVRGQCGEPIIPPYQTNAPPPPPRRLDADAVLSDEALSDSTLSDAEQPDAEQSDDNLVQDEEFEEEESE